MIAIIFLLEAYKNYVIKFTDQIERRLLKGETIPAEEKIFSIFEAHTAHSAVESNINIGASWP